eukprot:Protomagalhaensia_sp_Gyna_25__2166@NODE_2179_length_1238_cov_28_677231_g1802_i0_p1_GENE_NODE_2179_length_1238_cov_28_677231_g1802_i0NODE_2179_length_1238_cov_28_677231_g1802_i0_p1_ORF_typecomplete_len176_score22_29_NODE_2179_length_1238_cov_28_677231_g1802_i0427954
MYGQYAAPERKVEAATCVDNRGPNGSGRVGLELADLHLFGTPRALIRRASPVVHMVEPATRDCQISSFEAEACPMPETAVDYKPLNTMLKSGATSFELAVADVPVQGWLALSFDRPRAECGVEILSIDLSGGIIDFNYQIPIPPHHPRAHEGTSRQRLVFCSTLFLLMLTTWMSN